MSLVVSGEVRGSPRSLGVSFWGTQNSILICPTVHTQANVSLFGSSPQAEPVLQSSFKTKTLFFQSSSSKLPLCSCTVNLETVYSRKCHILIWAPLIECAFESTAFKIKLTNNFNPQLQPGKKHFHHFFMSLVKNLNPQCHNHKLSTATKSDLAADQHHTAQRSCSKQDLFIAEFFSFFL